VDLLQVETREDRGWTVVTARGQLDVATAPRFRQVLSEAQYGGSTRLVVDLDGVEFLDSFGLGVLIGALRRARTHDGELVLACSRERVLHVLEVTRLTEVLDVVDDLAAVLDRTEPA
jgi:anti-sigma B factor antagonist